MKKFLEELLGVKVTTPFLGEYLISEKIEESRRITQQFSFMFCSKKGEITVDPDTMFIVYIKGDLGNKSIMTLNKFLSMKSYIIDITEPSFYDGEYFYKQYNGSYIMCEPIQTF